MKMTKKGVVPAPKEEVWTGKCRHCKSEYTASGNELMQEDGNACPTGWRLEQAVRFAVCELCGQRVYFDRIVTRGQHDSPWKVVPGSEFAR